ncbi:hypothetical protein AWB75_05492 [Caballeronia catudaia]|uniref:Uncharacterized protein n=1 Tax=Caballeronia catudaia TaxID=1777136 RepID=A0A158CQF6_9BURK|nr:hypothetical protein AWB75_05492 [Caballeronia catudaia]
MAVAGSRIFHIYMSRPEPSRPPSLLRQKLMVEFVEKQLNAGTPKR